MSEVNGPLLESATGMRGLSQGIGLYIHIPFCQTKCPYCDFNTYAGINHLVPSYMGALAVEIARWGELLGHPNVNTIFFGGGTPSLLQPEELGKVLGEALRVFNVVEGAEVTVEANPDDVTVERLTGFRELGVNRLSMGFQSLDEGLLRVLGRRHSAVQAKEAYARTHEAGFGNVSVDLMYGLPYQGLEEWQRTLEEVLGLGPEHISAYCLTLEGGTPMEAQVRHGTMPEPDSDLAAEMYLWAEEKLSGAGYRHYEISNWAKPGYESRHNLTYWHNLPYLGVGPGAHSYLGGFRFYNVASPQGYIVRAKGWSRVSQGLGWDEASIRGSGPVDGVERIDRRLEMGETMMLGMRLDEGIALEGFQRRFGIEVLDVYPGEVDELIGHGLIELSDGAIRLTQRGRLLGNEVFSRFLSASQMNR